MSAEIEDWIRGGLEAGDAGDLDAAESWYSKVLAAQPRHADALFLLGEIVARRGEWARAESLFGRAVAVNGDEAPFHFWRGVSLQHLGRLDAADDSLRRWLELRLKAADRGDYRPPAAAARIPDTTLCCVDCRFYELTGDALARTLARCHFDRAVLFTDAPVRFDGVETIRIDPITSLEQYSAFMIRELARHVETEFALVIQYDGYVLSGERWRPEFQDFDYIGARWQTGDDLCIGNGGFSLRSRKLLRALQDRDISRIYSEDQAIGRIYRPLLERKHGIRYAPADVADRFSFETIPPGEPTFGFHGLGHLVRLYGMSDADIAAYRPQPMTVRRRPWNEAG